MTNEERILDTLERLSEQVQSLISDVRDVLLLHHEVRRLRDRVSLLEQQRDSNPPPTSNGQAAE